MYLHAYILTYIRTCTRNRNHKRKPKSCDVVYAARAIEAVLAVIEYFGRSAKVENDCSVFTGAYRVWPYQVTTGVASAPAG